MQVIYCSRLNEVKHVMVGRVYDLLGKVNMHIYLGGEIFKCYSL